MILDKTKNSVETDQKPLWVSELKEEEVEFIKNFLMASGSIKRMANIYATCYPTIRKRIDRLILKIQVNERKESDQVVTLINQLEKEGKIDQEIAKTVVSEYSKSLNCLIVDR